MPTGIKSPVIGGLFIFEKINRYNFKCYVFPYTNPAFCTLDEEFDHVFGLRKINEYRVVYRKAISMPLTNFRSNLGGLLG